MDKVRVLCLVLATLVVLAVGDQTDRVYQYLTYHDIVDEIAALDEEYPDIIELWDLQDHYGIPSPGLCERQSGDGEECVIWLVRITDETTLVDDPERPEVFFSGTLHGNERIGPTTVTETLRFLCENYGRDPWLTELVNTRSIYITPATNALGYYENKRTENNIDINRDFPYLSDGKCMQTAAGRALNEVWRDHMFQLAITFHGGAYLIGYEWGTNNHLISSQVSTESPDHAAQVAAANRMKSWGGSYGGSTYEVMAMSALYPVDGGMEDWAYAASWENDVTNPPPINTCYKSGEGHFDDYDESKTVYNSHTHRAFNYLVETANMKIPKEGTLGHEQGVLTPSRRTDGHIPRNIRLALTLIDIVEPYVWWVDEENEMKTLDKEPMEVSAGDVVSIKWRVGGGYNVDETDLVAWSGMTDNPEEAQLHTVTKIQGGKASSPIQGFSSRTGVFSGDIDLEGFEPGYYRIAARAQLDKAWAEQTTPDPAIGPQSHFVNARTNPDWFHKHNRRVIRGRRDWFSVPILVAYAIDESVDGSEPTAPFAGEDVDDASSESGIGETLNVEDSTDSKAASAGEELGANPIVVVSEMSAASLRAAAGDHNSEKVQVTNAMMAVIALAVVATVVATAISLWRWSNRSHAV